ncbi:twin-arginine translocation signal domain-containing protein [Magnetospirillum sp. XM-1]|uniref:twin-arginine translocation signal domain-containing protein n=1 Tax=Magnetospirillum sp. XM-1 TaxID=1663591 RepID=UPI000AEADAC0|nr:twin-arginine translocation signal domain-containing protein [Magnetospirillum sp. XM-1]
MTTKSPESQSSESKTVLNRRGLLKGAVLSAGAAGAAAAGMIGAGQDAQAASETQTGAGYRETEHVRRAYEAAGF